MSGEYNTQGRIELSPEMEERRKHFPEIVGMYVTRRLMAENGIGLREAREMYIRLEEAEHGND